jgi:hypothetical protein
MQQIGGQFLEYVSELQKEGAPMIPVSIDYNYGQFRLIYKKGEVIKLDPNSPIKGWTNYYRSDDVSAVAYFYLDKPSSKLPAIQPVDIRTKNLR